MKFRLIILSGCLTLSILLIGVLLKLSDTWNHLPNDFIRLFPPHLIYPKSILDIKYDSYYIAGASASQIYLGNYTAPAYILKSNSELTDTDVLKLQFPTMSRALYLATKIVVDSNDIYVYEGYTPAIFHSALPDLNISLIKSDTFHFTAFLPLSPASKILRTYDSKRQQNILSKEINSPPFIKHAPGSLEKQLDGIFCTDGTLVSASRAGPLFYVYYHRNLFTRLDSNLDLIYKAHTIDTNSTVKIKIQMLETEKEKTISTPVLPINLSASVNNKYLFIHSGLRANNEGEAAFNKHPVIDVYEIKDGKYKYSFYLPMFKNNKIKSFYVHGRALYAIYDHFLYSFQLNL